MTNKRQISLIISTPVVENVCTFVIFSMTVPVVCCYVTYYSVPLTIAYITATIMMITPTITIVNMHNISSWLCT